MDIIYDLLRFVHVISFVFMSVLLFNLIIANERVILGMSFNFEADAHLEKVIKNGFNWCYIFQATTLITGIFLLLLGNIGIEGLWTDWIVITKTIILIVLMGTVSYVHFKLQPKIESFLAVIKSDKELPDTIFLKLKPFRLLRKWITAFYLFLVISAIVLGIQVYAPFSPILTIVLIVISGLFSLRADRILLRFGWI
jgi:hypothetical protein